MENSLEFSSKAEAELALDYFENQPGSADFHVMLVGDSSWRLMVRLDPESASEPANCQPGIHVHQISSIL
jgi:hypothetical protein